MEKLIRPLDVSSRSHKFDSGGPTSLLNSWRRSTFLFMASRWHAPVGCAELCLWCRSTLQIHIWGCDLVNCGHHTYGLMDWCFEVTWSKIHVTSLNWHSMWIRARANLMSWTVKSTFYVAIQISEILLSGNGGSDKSFLVYGVTG